jgi:hypothetical protein
MKLQCLSEQSPACLADSFWDDFGGLVVGAAAGVSNPPTTACSA